MARAGGGEVGDADEGRGLGGIEAAEAEAEEGGGETGRHCGDVGGCDVAGGEKGEWKGWKLFVEVRSGAMYSSACVGEERLLEGDWRSWGWPTLKDNPKRA